MPPTSSIIIAPIAGHAKMAPQFRRTLGILRPHQRPDRVALGAALRDVDATAALAKLLDEKILAVRTADGRVDMRDLAREVLLVVRPSAAAQARVRAIDGDKLADALAGAVEDAAAIHALSLVLTQAFETQQTAGGHIEMQDVAAHVIGALRRQPR